MELALDAGEHGIWDWDLESNKAYFSPAYYTMLGYVDVQMPELDGVSAASAIRKLEAGSGKRVPVIALTAGALTEERDRCLEAGMDAFLTKPIKADLLSKALHEFIRTS